LNTFEGSIKLQTNMIIYTLKMLTADMYRPTPKYGAYLTKLT